MPLLSLRRGFGRERQKATRAFIIALDATGENVVIEAEDRKLSRSKRAGDRGLSLKIVELGDDIAANEGRQLGRITVCWVEGLPMGESAFDVA